MTGYLLSMFGISLALTLVIELVSGWLMGMKTRRMQRLLALVNVLTNPAAVLACWLGAYQLPVEIIVVLVEYAVYRWFEVKHPARLAWVCNLLSWSAGLIIGGII